MLKSGTILPVRITLSESGVSTLNAAGQSHSRIPTPMLPADHAARATSHRADGDDQSRVDEWSARFELACNRGEAVDLNHYVESAPEELREQLFVECLLVHVWRRRNQGGAYALADALREHPRYEKLVRRCFPPENVDAGSAFSPPAVEHCGRYQIVRPIGQGTFGNVFEGYDEVLHRRVALKVCRFRPSEVDEPPADFIREGRTLASLEHPGIIPVFDTGVTEDGYRYIVSRLVDGGNLEEWLETHPVSYVETATIMARVAEALQFAHQNGVVHRDVKLTNILMEADCAPVLGDFGLALMESERRRRRDEQTGSPCFMAPEQVRGDGVNIDGRTDIWGLGVCFYRLLTGEFPFPDGETVIVFAEILQRAPRPPRQINANIPVDLEAIVLRCLRKQVDQRWNSAADLADALHRWIASVSNAKDSRSHGAQQKAAEGLSLRKLFIGIAAAAVLLCGSLVLIADRPTSTADRHDARQLSPANTGDTKNVRVMQADERKLSIATPEAKTPEHAVVTSARTSEQRTARFDSAWRVGGVPEGFAEVAIDGRAQTIQAPVDLEGDFVMSLVLNVDSQNPRNGEGVGITLESSLETAAFAYSVEIAQAYSNGRTLAVHWPGTGIERIDVARGLRTLKLIRTGRMLALQFDGQTVRAEQIRPQAVWSAEELRSVTLTLNGLETEVTRFQIQPTEP